MQILAAENAAEDFSKAFDEFSDEIFRHCAFMVGNRERARELMQDAFMKTWEYIAEGHDIDNIRAFLYRTAGNLSINYLRKKKEQSLDELQEGGFDPGEEESRHGRDVVAEDQAMDLLHTLEEPYRTAVTLRYIEGLPPADIATITGASPNAVSVRINRGLSKLRSQLPHG